MNGSERRLTRPGQADPPQPGLNGSCLGPGGKSPSCGMEAGHPRPTECTKQIQRGLTQFWAACDWASFLGTEAYCGRLAALLRLSVRFKMPVKLWLPFVEGPAGREKRRMPLAPEATGTWLAGRPSLATGDKNGQLLASH